MDEELEHDSSAEDALPSVGARLRAAREAKGMSLAQVAGETRITERHLAALEAGDYSSIPGRTYALGFSRAYAQAVDLDSQAIADDVKVELDEVGQGSGNRPVGNFEPADPARVPSSKLGWISAAAILLLVAGAYVFYSRMLAPGAELPPADAEERAAQLAAAQADAGDGAPSERPSAAPSADPQGAVVFTALEDGIWVKFYDSNGDQLMQKQMEQGERYTVPADAQGPQIWTGRPDALSITIGGRSVPKLAEEDQVMKDIPVTADALNSRSAAPEPAPSPSLDEG